MALIYNFILPLLYSYTQSGLPLNWQNPQEGRGLLSIVALQAGVVNANVAQNLPVSFRSGGKEGPTFFQRLLLHVTGNGEDDSGLSAAVGRLEPSSDDGARAETTQHVVCPVILTTDGSSNAGCSRKSCCSKGKWPNKVHDPPCCSKVSHRLGHQHDIIDTHGKT